MGNPSDQIGIAELPGYTGWNRNRYLSRVDQCLVQRVGAQESMMDGYLNIFHFDLSSQNDSNAWTLTIACPHITTVKDVHGHVPSPLFYDRGKSIPSYINFYKS